MKTAIIILIVIIAILLLIVAITTPKNDTVEMLSADVVDDEIYDTFNDDFDNVSFYDDELDDEL